MRNWVQKSHVSFTATYRLFSKKVRKNLVRSRDCRTFAPAFEQERHPAEGTGDEEKRDL